MGVTDTSTLVKKQAQRIAEASQSAGGFSQQAKLALTFNLQASLEPNQIINRFVEWLQPTVTFDSATYINIAHDYEMTIGQAKRHSCYYQLTIGDDELGGIKFTRRQRFSEAELLQLEDALCLLLYPLRNAIKYQQALQLATQDPLTGVGNRGAFEKSLRREVDLARRHHSSLSILALDLDNFKSINDSYGHAAGDHVLKVVSQCILNNIRESDILYRTGGEEFTIILSKTEIQGALLLADRLCKAIAGLDVHYKGIIINATTSVGVSAYVHGDTDKAIIERADQALYRSKDEGRNRVSI